MKSLITRSSVLLMLVFALFACAAVPPDTGVTPQSASVVVHNDAPVAATVYVIDRGTATRLGTVNASRTTPFPIRGDGMSVSFYITSAKGNVTTNPIQNVRGGERLTVNIDPTIRLAYATR